MEDYAAAALCMATSVLLVTLILLVGWNLMRWVFGAGNPALAIGGAFFLGVASFLSVVRIVALVGGDLPWGIGLFATATLVVAYLSYRSGALKGFGTGVPSVLLSILIMMFVVGVIWVIPQSYGPASSPHASFGSIESGRYGNIALYLLSHSQFPVLGQNYGQSIMAAASGSLGGARPIFALYLWLSLSLGFLAVLLYGLFFALTGSRVLSCVGTVGVMLGGTSATFAHWFAVDSALPLVFQGYFDTTFGVGSIVLFVWWVTTVLASQAVHPRWRNGLILVPIFALAWMVTAPQNFLAACLALTGLVLSLWLVDPRSRFPQWSGVIRPAGLALALVLMFLLLRPFGGLFTPHDLLQDGGITGVLAAAPDTEVHFHPGLDHLVFFGNQPGFYFEHVSSLPLPGLGAAGLLDLVHRAFGALRVIFYPVVGVTALAVWTLWRRRLAARFGLDNVDRPELGHLSGIAFVVLAGSALLIFSVAFGINKWSISRFMLPGLVLGQMCWCLFLFAQSENLRSRALGTSLVYILMFLPAVGPMISLVYRVGFHGRFFLSTGLKTLISVQGIVGGG